MENLIERGIIMAHDDEPIAVHHLTSTATTLSPDPFHTFATSQRELSGDLAGDLPGNWVDALLDSGTTLDHATDTLIRSALA
ncbi:hypothetical protein, partial [Enterococcus faecalis]|uniref:hypothetical protein n=1 Tax=Enterococcus faecalis TaxID=1351 RepID=UPI00403F9743